MLSKKIIRPVLNLQSASTQTEIFQNEVLRPVLKLQNDELVVVFKSFCTKQRIVIDTTDKKKLGAQIAQVFKNIGFKNLLLGVVIGMLTEDELGIYLSKESEFRKRIVVMTKQRLTDNLYQ